MPQTRDGVSVLQREKEAEPMLLKPHWKLISAGASDRNSVHHSPLPSSYAQCERRLFLADVFVPDLRVSSDVIRQQSRTFW